MANIQHAGSRDPRRDENEEIMSADYAAFNCANYSFISFSTSHLSIISSLERGLVSSIYYCDLQSFNSLRFWWKCLWFECNCVLILIVCLRPRTFHVLRYHGLGAMSFVIVGLIIAQDINPIINHSAIWMTQSIFPGRYSHQSSFSLHGIYFFQFSWLCAQAMLELRYKCRARHFAP